MEKEDIINELKMLPLSVIEVNDGQLDGLPKNPRSIKKKKFEKLKQNIEAYPEMLAWRSILVYPLDNGHYIIIGGNMRYRAMKELGHAEAPCVVIPKDTTVEQLQAYTIIDNNGFGDWDWDLLANEWNDEWLEDWGLDLPFSDENEEENRYTAKIFSPHYEPSDEEAKLSECVDASKYQQLIGEINNAGIEDADIKKFLELAASRHIVFNYEKIADFYARSDEQIQRLMEMSALVIIDFNDAIQNGFVSVTQQMKEMWDIDHPDEN